MTPSTIRVSYKGTLEQISFTFTMGHYMSRSSIVLYNNKLQSRNYNYQINFSCTIVQSLWSELIQYHKL